MWMLVYVLKKVILADGALVNVKGARSVSLCHAVELPLPLNRANNCFTSGILTLGENLLHTTHSRNGHTSLTSPTSSSPSSKLKLKCLAQCLAPGLVELSSAPERKSMETDAPPAIDLAGEPNALLATDLFSQLWPITSINGSNSKLLDFETLLSSLLGPSANKEGYFDLLKADASAHTFDKKTREGGDSLLVEWRTNSSDSSDAF